MPDYEYLMKCAIDFGSTNTVMAWRIYEKQADGTLVVSEKLNPINNVKRIPSMMILQSDNLDNEAVKQDLYGDAAASVVRNSNTPPIVCDNFKQDLYTQTPGSKAYNRGVELCTRFFGFLREEFLREIYNVLPGHVTQKMKVVLYLSTPVRANPTHRTLMRKIAENAGFTATNGITEINTDFDEARCVVRYAMERQRDAMRDVLAKAGKPGGANLLFADVGGSTLDVSLENLHINPDGVETMDNISSWPNADVRYPLGGCMVDEAIRDYLVDQGYADSEYTRMKWENGDGKFRFRIFKEENNQVLQSGQSIGKLGMVASVCYDFEEGFIPERSYVKSPRKIDREIFEQEICKTYIDQIMVAIADLFRHQRPLNGRKPLTPGDVDAIFLAGDGSRLYFISQILRGDMPGRDPGFEKIKAEPELLFDNWENPSLCCALGALAEQEKMITPNYAREKYIARVEVYEHSAWLTDRFKKNPEELREQTIVEGDQTGKCNLSYFHEMNITEKYQLLPQKKAWQQEFTYMDHGFEMIAIKISVYRVGESGDLDLMGIPFVLHQPREMDSLLKGLADIAKVTAGIVAVTMAGGMDLIATIFGKETKLIDKTIDFYNTHVMPHAVEVAASVDYEFTIEENNHMKARIALKSKHFTMPANELSMDL